MTTEEMEITLLDYRVCTEDELNLILNICGENQETLKDILYAREGYRDFDIWLEDLAENLGL